MIFQLVCIVLYVISVWWLILDASSHNFDQEKPIRILLQAIVLMEFIEIKVESHIKIIISLIIILICVYSHYHNINLANNMVLLLTQVTLLHIVVRLLISLSTLVINNTFCNNTATLLIFYMLCRIVIFGYKSYEREISLILLRFHIWNKHTVFTITKKNMTITHPLQLLSYIPKHLALTLLNSEKDFKNGLLHDIARSVLIDKTTTWDKKVPRRQQRRFLWFLKQAKSKNIDILASHDGYSLLNICLIRGYSKLAQLLIRYGADIYQTQEEKCGLGYFYQTYGKPQYLHKITDLNFTIKGFPAILTIHYTDPVLTLELIHRTKYFNFNAMLRACGINHDLFKAILVNNKYLIPNLITDVTRWLILNNSRDPIPYLKTALKYRFCSSNLYQDLDQSYHLLTDKYGGMDIGLYILVLEPKIRHENMVAKNSHPNMRRAAQLYAKNKHYWTTETHKYFPEDFQREVLFLYLVNLNMANKRFVMPKLVLYHVIWFLQNMILTPNWSFRT